MEFRILNTRICVFCFFFSPALFGQIQPVVPLPSYAPTWETRAARRWRTADLTCSGEKREPKHRTTADREKRKKADGGGLRDWPWQRGYSSKNDIALGTEAEVRAKGLELKKKIKKEQKWCGGGVPEKVSIAVVSSHGAVCGGKLGAAVEKSSAAAAVAFSSVGRQRRFHRKRVLSRAHGSRRLQRSDKKQPHLVQVGHEVLVERADQHVEGPLTLLGKRWCLQCGFFSIDYCKISKQNKPSSTPERSPPSPPWSFTSSHLTNKKSLNSWWSVNTGGDGRGGPNSGTLSSEKIFNLKKQHGIINVEVFSYVKNALTCNCHSGCYT